MSTNIALRIYIVTARPLAAVRDANIKQLTDTFSKVTVVERVTRCTKHDPDDVMKAGVTQYVDFAKVEGDGVGVAAFNAQLKAMHVNQLSNALKHVDALKKIASFSDTDENELLHLILEDDCIVNQEDGSAIEVVRSLMNRVKATFSNDGWGIFLPCVSVSLSDETKEQQSKDIQLSKHNLVRLDDLVSAGTSFLSPTCNAYFVTPKFASAMLKYCDKIKFAWNVHLSYAAYRVLNDDKRSGVIGTKSLCLMDGSKTGHFISTLTGSNLLSLCPEYLELVRLVSVPTKEAANNQETLRKIRDIIDKFEQKSGVIKNHPDFLRIHAQQLVSCKKYADAHEVLSNGGKILLETPLAIINNTSSFMREYLNSFAFVQ